jgi:hypothetical protein
LPGRMLSRLTPTDVGTLCAFLAGREKCGLQLVRHYSCHFSDNDAVEASRAITRKKRLEKVSKRGSQATQYAPAEALAGRDTVLDIGSLTVTAVPSPTLLSTLILPPCKQIS